MTVTAEAPPRSIEQRREALRTANRIRQTRAEFKRELKRAPGDAVRRARAVLAEPPEDMRSMKIFDLLLACPRIGRVKANRILMATQASPSKTLAGLTDRQRRTLASYLR